MVELQSRSASRALKVTACACVLGLFAACSGDDSGPGSPSSGGSAGAPAQGGGAPATGGAAVLGGAAGVATGGTTSAGGAVTSGGSVSSGGSATGGARTGGDAGMGGSSGGTLATGGSLSAGGGTAGSTAGSGGVRSSGGESASGGKSSGGAAGGAGGTTASGGKSSGGGGNGNGSGGAGGISAGGVGGTGGSACPYTGHVTYNLARAANPSAAQTTAYALITTAMDKALGYYNCYTNITKSLNVVYEPSVQTADGNINGSLRFGSNTTYMDYRTAMHEIGHTVGIGQASNWSSFLANGLFTGSNALAQLQAINATLQTPLYTEVHADTQHFWPYGLNQQSEVKSEADLLSHCKMVVAIRKDLGL